MEAHPPLVGLGLIAGIKLIEQTNSDFNAELSEVLADGIGLGSRGGLGDVTSEGELGVTRESKVLLETHSSEQSGSLLLVLLDNLVQAGRNVEDTISQQTISISVDSEVTEENVGLEVLEDLVDDINACSSNRRMSGFQIEYSVPNRDIRVTAKPNSVLIAIKPICRQSLPS